VGWLERKWAAAAAAAAGGAVSSVGELSGFRGAEASGAVSALSGKDEEDGMSIPSPLEVLSGTEVHVTLDCYSSRSGVVNSVAMGLNITAQPVALPSARIQLGAEGVVDPHRLAEAF